MKWQVEKQWNSKTEDLDLLYHPKASQIPVISSAQAECPRPMLLIPGGEQIMYTSKIIYFLVAMTINFDINILEIKIGYNKSPNL